ncbi:unnamed protein product [Gadus morhua 'NCC']
MSGRDAPLGIDQLTGCVADYLTGRGGRTPHWEGGGQTTSLEGGRPPHWEGGQTTSLGGGADHLTGMGGQTTSLGGGAEHLTGRGGRPSHWGGGQTTSLGGGKDHLTGTLDDNQSLSPLMVALSWSPILGLAGPAAAVAMVRSLPADGQVQPRLGQYLGHNCLSDKWVWMDARFGERSCELIGALAALNPEAGDNFLDPSKARRKAQLIQLAFEKDLTHKFTSEWKDMLMRRFSSEKRRLPQY